jgi:hypothetical protein
VTTVNSRRGGDTAFEHIEKMRIVPFDLRSFAELLGRTLGALVPLLGYLDLPESLLNVIEHSSKTFKG